MDAYFVEMLRRLKLTKRQRADAIAKYTGVAETLHAEFYGGEYNDSRKLLIGSYGKRTHIRPPGDVDLLFKIPLETFEQYDNYTSNGQAALLQRLRTVLGKKYVTTEKIAAWGKVVLVKFADGTHNVEVLPGYEIDGVFKIPNSEDGGSWEDFHARYELNLIADSHARTGGKIRKLIRMIKRWRKENATMTIKAYEIEQYCVRFLDAQTHEGKSWSELVAAFFTWLANIADKDTSFIATASIRAAKARVYELTDHLDKACEEWGKVFGWAFPAYSRSLDTVYTLTRQFPSPSEEYVEDIFPVRINPSYSVSVSPMISGKGFRPQSFHDFIQRYGAVPKRLQLKFQATSNVPGPVQYWWKVRNFYEEARAVNSGKGLRGEIKQGEYTGIKTESTLYKGTHYVECYIIKDDVCVAKTLLFVPISKENAE